MGKIIQNLSLFFIFSVCAFAGPIPNAWIVQVEDSVDVNEVAHGVGAFTRGNVSHIYKSAIKGFAIQVPPGVGKAQILSRAGVIKVEPDLEIRIASQRIPTGIDRIDIELNNLAKIDGIDERVDVDVAIIDTGIDGSHPDLNVFAGQNFTTGPSSNWGDDVGHGTHVAGTVAALDNNIGVVGVVPGARLWAVKVLKEKGPSFLSFALGEVDWVTANADQIEVANMSLSATGVNSIFHTAIQNSVNAGVVYVVAASNDSQDILGDDKVFGTSDDIIPAAYPEVATISALADADGEPGGVGGATSSGLDDSFAGFSNFSAAESPNNPVDSGGGGIDIMMPGVDIRSTVPVGTGQTVNAQWDGEDHQANGIEGSTFGDVDGLIFSCGLGNGVGEANTCPNDVAGNIAHIRRGDNTFADKVAHAESKGAIGVIISNNVPGNFLGTLGGSSPLVCVSVSQADGDELDLISGAGGTPGSVTVIVDDYDIFSGTSMASPHAAGLAALYIATNGRANNASEVYAIRQALIDSAAEQTDSRGLSTLNDQDSNNERLGYYIFGDVNYDSLVNTEDVYLLFSGWLTDDVLFDLAPFGGDNIVNFEDYAIFQIAPDF